jgi:geranylgeranyl diphosphate synthase, type II
VSEVAPEHATAASRHVREVLAEYGALAGERLRAYLKPGDGDAALYRLAADYPGRGGRSLRGSICVAAARAFGADAAEALNTAAALEILHNAFLVHDDVEDDSEERRGRPALHLLHGVPIAVNVGDALAVLSLRPLLENLGILGSRVALGILEEAQRMARESVEGQALELGWRQSNEVALGEADYLTMILKKTCWYTTIYPLRAGALIGTRGGVDLDRFVRFGFFVGAAFQIQDDLLNLIGDPDRYGKELNGDIWEGKRTLMLIHLLGAASAEDRARVVHALGKSRAERTVDDVEWIRERMDHYGSIDHARQIAHGLAGAALHEFSVAYEGVPDSRDKRFLGALPSWAIERT